MRNIYLVQFDKKEKNNYTNVVVFLGYLAVHLSPIYLRLIFLIHLDTPIFVQILF